MADLHIVREHALGLSKARKIAFQWAEQVEGEFAMRCSYAEGKTSDEVEFARDGVKGTLLVTKEHFELRAHLGFLLGAFKSVIEAEIVKNLDALLATSSHVKVAKPGRAKGGRTA
jgi:putative polyhydroxyalkanoate system protein